MKHIIQQLIDAHPKHWGSFVKKNNSIMQVIQPLIDKHGISVQAATYCYMHDYDPVCKNSNTKTFTWYANGFAYCGKRGVCKCHNSDAVEKSKQTNLLKYGQTSFAKTEQYRQKTKETNLQKFGVEHASWNAGIRDKAKNTCVVKYGTQFPIQLEEFKNKLKDTKNNRYGEPAYSNPAKRISTMLETYNVENAAYINMQPSTLAILKSEHQFRQFVTDKSKQFVSSELDLDPNTVGKYAAMYNCLDLFSATGSKWEEEISALLTELNVTFVRNYRKLISPFEVDFYLPDYNIAIEVNGNYWHCEDKKGKQYHHLKWLMCKENSVDLFQFFEDELQNAWPVVESKIRYLCHKPGKIIGARLLSIDEVLYTNEVAFLRANHIQGPSSARNASLGAYYNGELVGLISWMQRKNKLEITRFATSITASFPGLFSKMLKQVKKKLDFEGTIVSFSNNGHSNGNLYRAAGFAPTQTLGPAYWYMFDYGTRENRQKYMKHKIKKRFNVDISNKTEFELMDSLGYKRIWDSGKIRWELQVLKKENKHGQAI